MAGRPVKFHLRKVRQVTFGLKKKVTKRQGYPEDFFPSIFEPFFWGGGAWHDYWIWSRETKKGLNRCLLLTSSILNGPEDGVVRGREVGGRGVRMFYFPFWLDKSMKWATDDSKHHFWFPLNNSTHESLRIQQKVFGSKFKKKQVPSFFFHFSDHFFISMGFLFWRLDLIEGH